MFYKCSLETSVMKHAVTIRIRASAKNLSQVYGKGYKAIANYLGELQEQPAGAPFAIYYNIAS